MVATSWFTPQFGLEYVRNSELNWKELYKGVSTGADDVLIAQEAAIRPIISFPTSMYRLDTSTTPAKIVKK